MPEEKQMVREHSFLAATLSGAQPMHCFFQDAPVPCFSNSQKTMQSPMFIVLNVLEKKKKKINVVDHQSFQKGCFITIRTAGTVLHQLPSALIPVENYRVFEAAEGYVVILKAVTWKERQPSGSQLGAKWQTCTVFEAVMLPVAELRQTKCGNPLSYPALTYTFLML